MDVSWPCFGSILILFRSLASAQTYFYACLIFIALPLTVNLVLLCTLLSGEMRRSEPFNEWFTNNTTVAAIFLLIACTKLDAIRVLWCRWFEAAREFIILCCPVFAHL